MRIFDDNEVHERQDSLPIGRLYKQAERLQSHNLKTNPNKSSFIQFRLRQTDSDRSLANCNIGRYFDRRGLFDKFPRNVR